jgi:hypothetical protein
MFPGCDVVTDEPNADGTLRTDVLKHVPVPTHVPETPPNRFAIPCRQALVPLGLHQIVSPPGLSR